MKKENTIAVAAPTEPKIYTVIYPFVFGKDDNGIPLEHNIQYRFADKKDANGYYEQLQMRSISGLGEPALRQFAGSVLNRSATREAFELFLSEQIALQERN